MFDPTTSSQSQQPAPFVYSEAFQPQHEQQQFTATSSLYPQAQAQAQATTVQHQPVIFQDVISQNNNNAATTVTNGSSSPFLTEDIIALILMIVGFFVGGPIIWLLCFVLYRTSTNETARRMAKISLFLAIGTIVICVGFPIVMYGMWYFLLPKKFIGG